MGRSQWVRSARSDLCLDNVRRSAIRDVVGAPSGVCLAPADGGRGGLGASASPSACVASQASARSGLYASTADCRRHPRGDSRRLRRWCHAVCLRVSRPGSFASTTVASSLAVTTQDHRRPLAADAVLLQTASSNSPANVTRRLTRKQCRSPEEAVGSPRANEHLAGRQAPVCLTAVGRATCLGLPRPPCLEAALTGPSDIADRVANAAMLHACSQKGHNPG